MILLQLCFILLAFCSYRYGSSINATVKDHNIVLSLNLDKESAGQKTFICVYRPRSLAWRFGGRCDIKKDITPNILLEKKAVISLTSSKIQHSSSVFKVAIYSLDGWFPRRLAESHTFHLSSRKFSSQMVQNPSTTADDPLSRLAFDYVPTKKVKYHHGSMNSKRTEKKSSLENLEDSILGNNS